MTEKCSYCKRKIINLPFRCKFCGDYFCSCHRLPEDHNCDGLNKYKNNNIKRWQKAIIPEKEKLIRQEISNFEFSSKTKLKRFWYKNKRWMKKLFFWIIVLLIIYISFQYYQNNKEKTDNYIENTWNKTSSYVKEAMPLTYKPQHNTPVNKTYQVYYGGLNKIELILYKEVYDYFIHDASHEYVYYVYNDYEVAPIGWEIDYWKMFLSNENDEYVIKDIITQTKFYTKSDGDKAVQAIVKFVQQIPYDWESLNTNSQYVQYPYETLYLNKGVCSEKALLMAKLLNELGYGVALFVYQEDHMAVGIDCPYDKSNYQSGYCFIEPSDVYPIGLIPTEYVGGVRLVSTPQIIQISQGKSYSK
ncbi:MAG: hypothetical protein KKD48_01540 [Nanoarchaeota archaeon]|nr:hypothetical protein [Nanoarchaeota archaeon]